MSTTGSVERFAMAAATLIATQVLPTPPLVENTEIRRPGVPARLGRRLHPGGRRTGEELAHAVDRLVETRFAADHDRIACAGTQRLLQHVGRELVHGEDDTEHAVRARDPVHVLEADRTGEPGTEHRDHRPCRVEPLHQVFHRLELTGACQLDREPRAQLRVGLDDGDVVARGAGR